MAIAEALMAAVWRELETGALLRLTVGGAPLSVAWSHPAGGEWAAGVGVAAEGSGRLAWANGEPPSLPGPWFGGWTFAGDERWVLPRVLAWWAGGRTWAAAFGEGAEEALDQLGEADPVVELPRAAVVSQDGERWTRGVNAALAAIAAGTISKVVLARALEVEAERPFEERRILKVLEARFPTCRTFLLRLPDGAAFLGATPETLCRVRGRTLQTEALAGTGADEALLSSEKDLREHALVREGIVESLRPLCTRVEAADEPVLKRLANLVHLCTPVRAELRPGVAPWVAARALHPTPAVGGTPRHAALEFLGTHEGLDRGWYAGAIGARGEDSLELSVGIRSARVHGTRATVFAGAGIVAGSTVAGEWLETERKAQALLGALGVEP